MYISCFLKAGYFDTYGDTVTWISSINFVNCQYQQSEKSNHPSHKMTSWSETKFGMNQIPRERYSYLAAKAVGSGGQWGSRQGWSGPWYPWHGVRPPYYSGILRNIPVSTLLCHCSYASIIIAGIKIRTNYQTENESEPWWNICQKLIFISSQVKTVENKIFCFATLLGTILSCLMVMTFMCSLVLAQLFHLISTSQLIFTS